MARGVVAAMHEAGVRRLIWIGSMGIYDEVPGEKHKSGGRHELSITRQRETWVRGLLYGNTR